MATIHNTYKQDGAPLYTDAPPAYPGAPPAPGHTTTIMVRSETVPQPINMVWPREPADVTCPVCQARVTTTLEYQSGDATCTAALVLCLLCGLIGGLIPLCMDSTKDAVHSCPNCQTVLGKNLGQFC